MKKALTIALKDFSITFRDPAALMIMVVTPFVLTLVIAFAFGGMNDTEQFANIPVIIVNQDQGDFSALLFQTLDSAELRTLLAPTRLDSPAAARAAVDANQAAAAIIIPQDFSANLAVTAAMSTAERPIAVLEVYGNPTQPISAGIVRSVMEEFAAHITASQAGTQVSIAQLIQSGRLSPQETVALQEIGQRAAQQTLATRRILLRTETGADVTAPFDWLGYMAPSMAVMFLMFTVATGGRSILDERDACTLPRILTTPTTPAQVLGGKVCGIFLTGVLQLTILVIASTLLFEVYWGDILPLAVVIAAVVAAATGWGTLLAALARSSAQATALGSAGMMIFGALAGNYLPRPFLPAWVRTISYISPNAWALESFEKLAMGGDLYAVQQPVIALLGMAVMLFGIATLAFRRQYK